MGILQLQKRGHEVKGIMGFPGSIVVIDMMKPVFGNLHCLPIPMGMTAALQCYCILLWTPHPNAPMPNILSPPPQHPNAAHKAIAELEQRLKPQGRKVTVVTQNIDRLHHKAGSKEIIELHGESGGKGNEGRGEGKGLG